MTITPGYTVTDLTSGTVGGDGVFDRLMTAMDAHLSKQFKDGRITGDAYAKTYAELTGVVLGQSTQFLLTKDKAGQDALLAEETVKRMQKEIELLCAQKLKVDAEVTNLAVAKQNAEYQLNNLLPQQVNLVKEQIEVQRAQTLGTRTDGTVIQGSAGKQIALYDQQITSFKRADEFKVAKMYLDSWTVQKTLDEGLFAPPQLTNVEIDDVMSSVRTNANL